MLPLSALPLVVRHFDAIDHFVAARLVGNRPWTEPGLTSLFCDLLDSRQQEQYRLAYSLSDLNVALQKVDPPTSVQCTIETHEYGPHMERWVTQADIGLIVNYRDAIDPSRSRSSAWLLQAKRLYPDRATGMYSEVSQFSAVDQAQADRAGELNDVVGFPLIRYLFYCPRPEALDDRTSASLAHARMIRLSGEIFDYAFGLALRDELMSGGRTTAAGIFISRDLTVPATFRDLHANVFRTLHPLAWFLLRDMTVQPAVFPDELDLDVGTGGGATPIPVEALVRGSEAAIESLREVLDIPNDAFRVFPAHTIEISVTAGHHNEETDPPDQ